MPNGISPQAKGIKLFVGRKMRNEKDNPYLVSIINLMRRLQLILWPQKTNENPLKNHRNFVMMASN